MTSQMFLAKEKDKRYLQTRKVIDPHQLKIKINLDKNKVEKSNQKQLENKTKQWLTNDQLILYLNNLFKLKLIQFTIFSLSISSNIV